MEQNKNVQKDASSITKLLKERLSLFENKADDSVIDERIRGDVEMRGANLWVLMFAIFIASMSPKRQLYRCHYRCHANLSAYGSLSWG